MLVIEVRTAAAALGWEKSVSRSELSRAQVKPDEPRRRVTSSAQLEDTLAPPTFVLGASVNP